MPELTPHTPRDSSGFTLSAKAMALAPPLSPHTVSQAASGPLAPRASSPPSRGASGASGGGEKDRVSEVLMEAKVLTKSFKSGSEDLLVLDKLRLKIMRGRGAAITGASGSGKSTLLYILGGLDQPSSGTVLSEGKDIFTLGDAALAAWRAKSVGFVFQFHHLLPEFTALENVAMPLMLHGSSRGEALERAEPILTRVGLSERLKHRPGLLSGGERQRVAIARALVMEPKILLADEPTGNLDNKNANLINELIMELTKEKGMSAVVATHNSKLASLLDVLYKLENGVLKELSREKWE